MDLRAAYELFVSEGASSDVRRARSTLTWLRRELAAAARRCARHGMANLVALDIAALAQEVQATSSLDDFILARGLDGWSFDEQMAQYAEAYPPSRKALRKTRSIKKQLAAIDWLQFKVAQAVLAEDGVGAWLEDPITEQLAQLGVLTLNDLIQHIDLHGTRWYRRLRGVGKKKAEVIEKWLGRHAATIGRYIRAGGAIKRDGIALLEQVVLPATAVRPLEYFIAPAHLDGRQGAFRLPDERCLLGPNVNDLQVIEHWVRSKRAGLVDAQGKPTDSHTQRNYRSQAERLLLWAILVRGKALSSLDTTDAIAYRDFLAAPPATWRSIRRYPRTSPNWRPFAGVLQPSAQAQALVVLKAFHGFLVNQSYRSGNPFADVLSPESMRPRLQVGHALSKAQWRYLSSRLAELPLSSYNLRLRLAVHLLYVTGLRLAELVTARYQHLQFVSYADADGEVTGWELSVLGKGKRVRSVPLPAHVLTDLRAYLASRGLPDDPMHEDNRDVALLGLSTDWLDRHKPRFAEKRDAHLPIAAGTGAPKERPLQARRIAENTLYRQIKQFFGRCATDLFADGDHAGSRRLAAASTHWLRHTHATHALAAGATLKEIQDNLGHADLSTTSRYLQDDKKARHLAMTRAFGESN